MISGRGVILEMSRLGPYLDRIMTGLPLYSRAEANGLLLGQRNSMQRRTAQEYSDITNVYT